MAKATTRKASTRKASSRVRIKGANEADKQNIALARKVNADEAKGEPVQVVQSGDKLANDGMTPREARDAQQAQFDKADEAGKAEMIAEATLSRAVRGY